VSFVLTAFLALVASVIGLVLGTISTTHTNWVDQLFSDFVRRRVVRLTADANEFWGNVVEAAILNFSDQQLVTGGVILIVAYFQLATISVYHFSVVMDLAWFSSNTHLLAVVVLRKRLREHFFRRAWRGLAMLIMCTMLFISSIFQGHWNWFDSYRCPATCLINQLSLSNIGGVPARWMFTDLTMLTWGYAAALIPLFDWSRNAWEKLKYWVCELYHLRGTRPANNSRLHWATAAFIWIYTILSSAVFEIAFQIMWWGMVLWGIVSDKRWGASALAISGQSENVWAFGQIVPFLLVVLPLLLSAEIYFGNVYTIVLMV
jgi:hypothetical protein